MAAVVLAVAGWLLWDLSPEVAFFFAPRAAIDLGGPDVFALEAARENRLVRIRGDLVDAVGVTEGRTGAARTVGRVRGTSLLVDRPGRAGAPVYEGRLLPLRRRAPYDEVAARMRAGGAPLGEAWLVLRDGERPRRGGLPVLGAAVLLLLAAVNLRALARALRPR